MPSRMALQMAAASRCASNCKVPSICLVLIHCFLLLPLDILELNALQVDELDLAAIGPEFEHNAVFPAKINTEFVEVSQSCLQPSLC